MSYTNGTGTYTNGNGKQSAVAAGFSALANLPAERAVLGAILIDPAALAKVEDFLKPADFYHEGHRYIFAAMLTLGARNEVIDPVTVSAELTRDGHLDEAGGMSHLLELTGDVTTTLHVGHHAQIVKERAGMRHLLGAAGKMAELTYAPDATPEKVIARTEDMLMEARQLGIGEEQEAQWLGDILRPLIDDIQVRMTTPGANRTLATGYGLLDYKLGGGLRPGDLAILAGRAGMGKSSLMFCITLHAAKEGKHIAIYSLEMSKAQIAERYLAMQSGVDLQKIRTGQLTQQEFSIIQGTAQALKDCPILIDDARPLTMADLRAKARRLHARCRLDLIAIDYLGLMSSGAKSYNRQEEVSEISRSLKVLAGELDLPILALSQLNRNLEYRSDKRPMLADLRESGSLEQDSDIVLFTYREAYYDESADPHLAEVIVGKQRNGETGTVPLYFKPEQAMFMNVEMERHDLRY